MNLLEMTLPELLKATETAFPDTSLRQNATSDLRVDTQEFIPTSGGLMVKSKVTNTNKGSAYETSVLLLNIEPSDESDSSATKVIGADGTDYYFKPIDINKTDVQVSCPCMDFRYRFATWNFGKGTLLGPKPEPYVKKTTTRPEANPSHSVGVCKHLVVTMDELQDKRLI